jgi:hemoglobin-like flavoprotein/NO-binding membrane sensor protein with MHYT domain
MAVTYDPILALLSLGVAIFGTMSAIALTAQLRDAGLSSGHVQLALINGALTLGIVAWATHFIAMRAFGFPASSDQGAVEVTALIGFSVLVAWGGFYVANLIEWGSADRLLGGLLIGIGIVGMHYRPVWYAYGCGAECNEQLMISLAAAVVLAAMVAVWVGFRRRRVWRIIASSCILGLAIALMSYAAMVGTYAVQSAAAADWRASLLADGLAPYAIAGGVALLSIGNIVLFAQITKHRLTRERIELVQWTYNKVEAAGVQVADIFYARLFEIAPQTRPLFPTDMSQQKDKLLDVLASAVLNLHQLDSVMAVIKDLGKRHVYYGVVPEHYKPVGEALIWTLERVLGNDFTPATKRAWVAAYKTLSEAMLAAAAEVRLPRARVQEGMRASRSA